MMKNNGAVFITVIFLSALIIFIVVAIANMILQDTYMVKRLRYSTQAQYIAEGGISHALATLAINGFSEFNTSTVLGDGSYNVSVSKKSVSGTDRWLIASTGSVENTARMVAVEVRDVSSPMMNNALSAGTNIDLQSVNGDITVQGDIHANNDLRLKEQGGTTSLSIVASGTSTGKATSSNNYTVQGTNVFIDDVANSGGDKPRLGMPVFNFAYFKQVAQNQGGTYYNSSQTFIDENLAGGVGVGLVYVDGDVTFSGSCSIRGGFVAKGDITLNSGNALIQRHDAKNRFPIFLSENGNRIKLYGQFSTAEGNIVYATNNIQIQTPGGKSTFAGTVIAGGSFDIAANNDLTISYGEITSYEAVPLVVKLVSWNR